MYVRKSPVVVPLLLLTLALPAAAAKKVHKTADESASGPAVMWKAPADLESRDLFYGPGGREHVPRGPYTFIKEDLDGTNPKFVVRDGQGTKWKVKLGLEARPETVATRLVWAVGYYANEDYFVRDMQVKGMPARLHRGQSLVSANGRVHNVRLKREEKDVEKKVGDWRWRQDAFSGTRELNGLKVLMAVLNNWDLKDENNHVYQADGERLYMVSDLGASLGASGRAWPREKSKDNLDAYSHSRFIRKLTPDSVDFAVPARPSWEYLVNPKEFISRVRLERIGHGVPRRDAKWMGQLLARLSAQQIRDAFRAGGYSREETEAFLKIMESRIAVLTDL